MSNNDNQKTQAIPSLEDLLQGDREIHAQREAEAPDEENAAPTEAIDFAALVASGHMPAPEEFPAEPSASGDMFTSAPPLNAPAMDAHAPPMDMHMPPVGAEEKHTGLPPMEDTALPMEDPALPAVDPMLVGNPNAAMPAHDMAPMNTAPPMNSGSMGSGPKIGGGPGGGGGQSSPPAGEKKSKTPMFIGLGFVALLLFCCCPLGIGGYYAQESFTEFQNKTKANLNKLAISTAQVDLQYKLESNGWTIEAEPQETQKAGNTTITLLAVQDSKKASITMTQYQDPTSAEVAYKSLQGSEGLAVSRKETLVTHVSIANDTSAAEALLNILDAPKAF